MNKFLITWSTMIKSTEKKKFQSLEFSKTINKSINKYLHAHTHILSKVGACECSGDTMKL